MKQVSTTEFSTKKQAMERAKIIGKNNVVSIDKTMDDTYVVIFLIKVSDIQRL